MRSLARFVKNNPWKRETLAAYYYSAYFRLELLLVHPGCLMKRWGREGEESPETESEEHYRIAARISHIVNKVCDKTDWESKCLVRALTAQRMLRKRQIPSTLYMGCGMRDGSLVAHAWLRCGELCVTGGDGSGYVIVDRFYMGGGEHRDVSHLGNCGPETVG